MSGSRGRGIPVTPQRERGTSQSSTPVPMRSQSQVPNTAAQAMDEMDEDRFLDLPSTDTPSAPVPPAHQRSQSTSQGTNNDVTLNEDMMNHITASLVGDLSSCSTIGALTKLVPVPAQPGSKTIFEDVFTACQKKGAAENLLKLWQNKLAASAYDQVPALNSLKAPTVQICKEALGPNDNGLSNMNLLSTLESAKESALTQMIAIKQQEFSNLTIFTSQSTVRRKLASCWTHASQGPHLIPEHRAILGNAELGGRFARTAVAIGESAYLKVANARQGRENTRQEAARSSTSLPSEAGEKSMQALIEETLKRREQSRRDKRKNKSSTSGNGRRGAGPSKKKNQKKGKKTGVVKTARGRKPAPSTRKQQKRQ